MSQNLTKKTKFNWLNDEVNFFLEGISNRAPELPIGIYRIEQHPIRGLYLFKCGDKFHFPYKIYGMETQLIKRVVKAYQEKVSNLGVLLNGIKGTGKTVTAELICNEINLPVIIVNQNFGDATASFINSIEQDIVVFFDEYEKIYEDHDHSILTVMDGVLSNEYRRLFLLTTNNMYLNENMLSRPSRIRYVKEFGDLSFELINEIVDDMLKYPTHREELIKYISTLRIITVDIVKSIIDEVNMFNEAPDGFRDVFNVKVRDDKFNVFDITDTERPIRLFSDVKVSHTKLNSDIIASNSNFCIGGYSIGKIIKLLDEDKFAIEITVPKKSDKELSGHELFRDNIVKMIQGGNNNEGGFTLQGGNDDEAYDNSDYSSEPVKLVAKTKVETIPVSTNTKLIRIFKIEQSYGSHYSFMRYF